MWVNTQKIKDLSSLFYVYSSFVVLFKNQQQHLGASLKYKFLGPTPYACDRATSQTRHREEVLR